jgi:hypothetical protein
MKAPSEKLVRAATLGMNRTSDVMELIPDTDEGNSELLGMSVAPLQEFSRRTGKPIRWVLDEIASMVAEDEE